MIFRIEIKLLNFCCPVGQGLQTLYMRLTPVYYSRSRFSLSVSASLQPVERESLFTSCRCECFSPDINLVFDFSSETRLVCYLC